MKDIKIFKQKDLLLKVNKNYDPTKLDLDSWDFFLDKLCGDREFQKEAIKNAIIYLASGRYEKIEDLVEENYQNNNELQAKYKYAKEHFERLNKKLEEQEIKQKYIFHFLSPNGYTTFFEYLKNGTLLEGQDKFRCELENLLEE